MSVIVNMNMPESCYECSLRSKDHKYVCFNDKDISEFLKDIDCKTRPVWCPIIEEYKDIGKKEKTIKRDGVLYLYGREVLKTKEVLNKELPDFTQYYINVRETKTCYSLCNVLNPDLEEIEKYIPYRLYFKKKTLPVVELFDKWDDDGIVLPNTLIQIMVSLSPMKDIEKEYLDKKLYEALDLDIGKYSN